MEQFLSAVTPSIALTVLLAGTGLVLLARARRPGVLRCLEGAPAMAVACVGVAAALLLYLWWTVGYLLSPVYSDHMEPAVAVTSALLLEGRPIYPDWRSGEGLYGTIYGPLLYAIHACLIFASQSIASTKLGGMLAIWCAIAVMSLEVWRIARSAAVAALALGCALLVLIEFHVASFWNRPEPFLVLLTALVPAALRLPGPWAAAGIGTLAGMAVGLKPYAMLFFLPAAAALVFAGNMPSSRLRRIMAAALCATTVSGAPFLLPGVSLAGYLDFLKVTAGHNFYASNLHTNFMQMGLIMTPLAAVWLLRRPASPGGRRDALALVISTLAIAVLGAKDGAGPYYLLPCIPLALYSTVIAAEPERPATPPEISGLAAAACIFFLYCCAFAGFVYQTYYVVRILTPAAPQERAAAEELRALYAAWPGAEMGASDDDNYSWTFHRPIGVIRGTPVHFDVSFLMDINAVGLGADAAEDLMQGCKVAQWILPANGVPFSQHNQLGSRGAPFTDKFRQAFHDNYVRVFSGRHYTVWDCRR